MIGHGAFGDAPSGPLGPQHHLERPSRAAVLDAEIDQGLASRCTHRPEVAQCESAPAPHLGHERQVGEAGVQRPRAAARRTRTQHEVTSTVGDRPGDEWQVARVERGVRVHEADDVVLGGLEPGPARRAEAPHRRADDIGTELGGESGRAVVGPVVHDDGPVAGRETGKDPAQCLHLVQDGQDHVGHRGTVPSNPRRTTRLPITNL